MNKELKPCPFCGGEKIGYSVKVAGSRWVTKYHVAMYCKECNCYGARTLITPAEEEHRLDVEYSEKYRDIAIEAWNRRATDE